MCFCSQGIKNMKDKKKKGNKVKPTFRQKEAFKKIVENHGNISKTMREVGYSKNTAKKPTNLTESKGWEMLCEQELPDDLLLKVHKEGLEAMNKKEPDYSVRHKYLDTAYKIRNKVIDKVEHTGEIKQVEVIEIVNPNENNTNQTSNNSN
jgi:hypothetical protein